ncbi:MauE/DoxX family redox-associated membrane protein [Actinoplanes sp. GCM10030250]|uniref:MauE/DoxX family redox-associated membrane protein n=1 Tax=Actinoplanes sp. GCM10030250 TaxID=3273376 RepID=UPI003605C935
MRVFIAATTFLIIGVVAVSLMTKVRSRVAYDGFAGAVAEFGRLPARWARPGAALCIAAEFAVLTALAWPAAAAPGLAAASVLFACFTIALTAGVRRGSRAGCHCFGASSTPVAWRHVMRAGSLCAVAAAAAGCALVSPSAPLTALGAQQALIASVVALAGAAALVWLDDLIWLFRGTTST